MKYRGLLATALFAAACLALSPFAAAPARADGAFVTMDIFSGRPGATLQVSGGGFTNGETVLIYLSTIAGPGAGSATAGSNSLFGPVSVTVPLNEPQGPLAVIAVGSTSRRTASNSFYVNPLTPAITVTNSVNTPFSILDINGSGFGGSENVLLTLAGSSSTVAADASGSFTGAHLTIPAAAPGVYLLRGTGQTSTAQSAPIYFYIGGFYASASPSSFYIVPGDILSFSGSGFASGESIHVTQGTSAPLATFAANSLGGFTNAGGFTVPFSMAGSQQTFSLTGQTSRAHASTTVTIGQLYPSVTPSAYYIMPGNSLNFSGSGFLNGETVDVFKGASTTPLATFAAGPSGTYLHQGAFIVPFSYTGTAPTFNLTGRTSHATASVQVMIGSLYPQISPSAYFILPGQMLSLSGSGFAPNEIIDIAAGTQTGRATTNGLGAFSGASIMIPYSALQFMNVTAAGETSNASATVTVTLGSYFPTVAPSSYYLQPGSQMSFSGSNFAPNENVRVSLGLQTVGTISTNSLGALNANTYQVPFSASGSLAFSFDGLSSGGHANATVTIAPYNDQIASDNYYVLPGSTVHITASGFAPGETIQFTAGSFSSTAVANSSGATAPVPVTIPYGSSGSIAVHATGQLSGAQAQTIITLASFYPTVTPNTYFTAPGSSVTFTGTGFAPNESVTITKGAGTPVGTATTDGFGAFSAGPIAIPVSARGSVHFAFTGLNSQTPATVDIGLSGFYPAVSLSNYYAVGGTPITISGSGFAPNEPVNISFGAAALPAVTADSSGAFADAVNVPYATAGSKTVTATGSLSGAVATTTFTQAPVYPSVFLGAYHGAPGTAVNFIGSGYLPNEPIDITTDRTGATVVHTFSSNAAGNFNNSGYVIPAAFTQGNLTLTITGEHSLVPQSIVFYVNAP